MKVNDWLEREVGSEPRVAAEQLTSLRAALDAEVTSVLADVSVPPSGPVVLSKSRLAQLDRCERSAVASATSAAAPDPPSPAALAGRALDHFVGQVLVGGRIGESATDLRAAFLAHGDHEALARLAGWEGRSEGDEFDRDVDALAAAVLDAWVGVDADWAPRTQTRASLLLGGDQLRVSGVIDVELGGPHTARPGVVVEVKSGRAIEAHRHETYLYGLLVALRDGVAPAAVARWYPGAAPVALTVTIGTLEAAAERVLAGLRRWVGVTAGEEPTASPGVWCGWCPIRAECDVAIVEAAAATPPSPDDPADVDEGPW